jgi:hypothetical protein
VKWLTFERRKSNLWPITKLLAEISKELFSSEFAGGHIGLAEMHILRFTNYHQKKKEVNGYSHA